MTDEEQKIIISNNLKKLIERSGKQQKDIAIDLDMSSSRFNTYVKGKAIPPVPVLWQIANYFHVQLTDIVDKKNEVEHYHFTKRDIALIKAYANAGEQERRIVNYAIRIEDYLQKLEGDNNESN